MRIILLCVLLFSPSIYADLRFSEIFGVVTDRQGNPLPGAEVSAVKNDGKEFVEVRRTRANEHGKYRLVMLDFGEYEIHFEMTGFWREHTCYINLSPPKNKRIDMSLGYSYQWEEITTCPVFSDIDPTSSTILSIFSYDFMQETSIGHKSGRK